MATLLFFLVLLFPAPQSGCKPQFAPLDTGSHSAASPLPFWKKDLAGDWAGGGWLGWSHGSDRLRPVRLIVRNRPEDSPQDEDNVTVQSVPEVTYAVRCISGLREGGILDAGVVNRDLQHDGAIKVSVDGRHYEMRLESAREDLFDAKVVLTDGRRTQVLYSADGFADEPHFEVEWAGDLDGDGKLDLVVNLNRKYSLHPHRLLLSSRASRGALVGDAAVFETSD